MPIKKTNKFRVITQTARSKSLNTMTCSYDTTKFSSCDCIIQSTGIMSVRYNIENGFVEIKERHNHAGANFQVFGRHFNDLLLTHF